MASETPVCWIMQPVHPVAGVLLAEAGIDVHQGAQAPADPARVRALVSRNAPVDASLMDRLPELAVVAKHGAGIDAIDMAAADARGIVVVATPGANAQSVAEHALMLMLAVAKRLVAADKAMRADDFAFKFRSDFRELQRLTLGIVGLGDSGRRLARMAGLGLGMRVVAHSPSVPDAVFAEWGVTRLSLAELLACADVVSLHVPARPDNARMFGAAAFAAMKSGAILVNTARGSLVDETALAEALSSGRLGGAGLDVFAPEPPLPGNLLLALDNVVLSPHAAGSTGAALERMARAVAEQVIDVLAGRRPAHLANPATWDRRQTKE